MDLNTVYNQLNLESSLKTCRFCLKYTRFTTSLHIGNTAALVQDLTSINVLEVDNFPDSICKKCMINLKFAHEIQQKFIESNKKLLAGYKYTEIEENHDLLQLDIKNEKINFDETNRNEILAEYMDPLEICENDKEEYIFIKTEYSAEESPIFFYSVDNVNLKCEDEPEHSASQSTAKKIKTENPNSCTICGDMPKNMKSHTKNHFTGTQVCDLCEITFENIETYKKHLVIHPKLTRRWKCEDCDSIFQYRSLYKIHVEKVHLKNVEPISEPEIFNDKRLESLNNITDEDKVLKCPVCNKPFSDLKQFNKHIRVHNKVKCTVCGVMITKQNIRTHMTTHDDPKTVVCHICGEQYRNKECLRGHLFYTHSTNKYPCEDCDKVFRKSYHRKLHIKKCHTGEKDHTCELCGKSFYTQYTLKKHVKMTHEKLRPYECEFCKRSFSSRYALNTHRRQHTNDAPYVCDMCGEGFRQNVSLQSHKKSKHNIAEEKTAKCKECGKMFQSEWAVMSHTMRMH